MEAIIQAITSHRFAISNEAMLQDAIAIVLEHDAGIRFEREVILSARDRIDFLLDGGIGLEVKVDGSLAALTRQLHRYAQHGRINGLIVVTNRARLRAVPSTLNGKPVRVASLLGGSL